MKKILVVRFSSIGDIVLTTPVLRALAAQLPQAEVHFCTKKQFENILKDNPYVHSVHCLDKNFSDLLRQLKAEKFDFVLDLHHNLRSFRLKWHLGRPSASFDKLNWRKWLYVKFKMPMPKQHIVERYMATAAKLGIRPDGKGLDYFVPEKDNLTFQDFPDPFQQGFVAFAIGGQHATKRLPSSKIIELSLKIDRPLIFLGGREDREVAEYVVKALRNQKPHALVMHGCGLWNLNQAAAVVRLAEQVWTHDTAMMHVAAAFGKKIVAIWGNTTPELGMYPYQSPHFNLENKQLKCRPCSKIGYASCPEEHFKCMNALSFTEELKQFLAK